MFGNMLKTDIGDRKDKIGAVSDMACPGWATRANTVDCQMKASFQKKIACAIFPTAQAASFSHRCPVLGWNG